MRSEKDVFGIAHRALKVELLHAGWQIIIRETDDRELGSKRRYIRAQSFDPSMIMIVRQCRFEVLQFFGRKRRFNFIRKFDALIKEFSHLNEVFFDKTS